MFESHNTINPKPETWHMTFEALLNAQESVFHHPIDHRWKFSLKKYTAKFSSC